MPHHAARTAVTNSIARPSPSLAHRRGARWLKLAGSAVTLGATLAACAPMGAEDGAAGSADEYGSSTAAVSSRSTSTHGPSAHGGGRNSASSAPRLAFVSRRTGNEEIFVVRSDGSGLQQITNNAADDFAPAWTPDGSRIVFASERSGALALYVHDLATGAETAIATGLPSATAPRVSPDGTRVVFEGAVTVTALPDIYTVPIAGGTPTQLTTNATIDSAPVWSSDGASLYFLSDRGGTWEIYAMGADGSGAHAVTTGASVLGRFDLTADGSAAYFSRLGPSNTFPIVRRDLASGVDTVITADLASEPALSPAGDRLAVSTTQFGAYNPDIALIDPSGIAAPVQLASASGIDSEPVWDRSGL